MRLTNTLLKGDGFSWRERLGMCIKGSYWLYGPGGLFARNALKLAAYHKPGFHPWQHQVIHSDPVWVSTFEATGDPMRAGAALFQAARCSLPAQLGLSKTGRHKMRLARVRLPAPPTREAHA